VKRARSLLWQLGAFALAVTLLSLALHIMVISFWLRPLLDQMIVQLGSRTQMAHALVIATPAAQRDALAARLQSKDFQVLRGMPHPTEADEARPMIAPPVGRLLRETLGPEYTVVHYPPADHFSFEPRFMRIGFVADGEPWHVELRANPPLQALIGTGGGWLALAALAVAASWLIGLRFIVKPIRRMAERIAVQGSSMRPLAVPLGASAEVYSLVESFNRLVDRVQAADRTKQHLLAGVSHDLRTPLARLRLRIETQCEPHVAAAAEPELRAVEHIVSQFLAFVHGDGRAVLGDDESLLSAASDVVASYTDQGHDVHLLIAASDQPMGAVAVRRLLTNLIDNALVHGKPPIQVIWRDRVSGERELGVWDHGLGLSPAQFGDALQPFVRLSSDPGIGHCGLGLAIVAQIAQQWGARLESRRDEAGRFGIVLVWTAAAAQPAGPLPSGTAASRSATPAPITQ
jgi:two-component system, OmpR family, osmolarity sensor histidine kinase EnvZ